MVREIGSYFGAPTKWQLCIFAIADHI